MKIVIRGGAVIECSMTEPEVRTLIDLLSHAVDNSRINLTYSSGLFIKLSEVVAAQCVDGLVEYKPNERTN